MIVASTIVRESDIRRSIRGRLIGTRLLTAVALTCAHLLGTDLLAMPITLAGGVWFGYSMRTGRERISYLATQFALGMLITLSRGRPCPSTDVAAGLERLPGIFIGSAMLDLLIDI